MFYIYKFLNQHEVPIYIGITGNITRRIQKEHFGVTGHLSDECYSRVSKVLYSKCVSEDDAKVKERYLVNKLSPQYNTQMNNGSLFSFNMPDFEWLRIPFYKIGLIKTDKKNKIKLNNINLSCEHKSHKSLKNGSIKHFKQIPSKSETLLQDICLFSKTAKISALSLNNVAWVFHEQIHRMIDHTSTKGSLINTIMFINKYNIDADNFCVIHDSRLIRNNLNSTSSTECGTPLYPKSAVLVSAIAVKDVLEHAIMEEIKPYSKRLETKGILNLKLSFGPDYSEQHTFSTLDDFVEFCKKNRTEPGKKIEISEKINKAMESIIDQKTAKSDMSQADKLINSVGK